MLTRSRRSRRKFLGDLAKLAGATTLAEAFPAAIQRALAIPADRRTGTLQDVAHVVILTQENRAFDHYFGALPGVRGFSDPFPIPVPDAPGITKKTVWLQPNATPTADVPAIAPFRLDTDQHFEYVRVSGAPHSWTDAQAAWNQGLLNAWPVAKGNHALGYYIQDDVPFQWALADAFTICDAYHCAAQAGTNTNRLFVFTGTNDPLAKGNGPVTYNDYDDFESDPGHNGGYTWTTYAERLEAAGISWQVYQDMADNFTDNPLAGFQTFRSAWFQRPGYSPELRAKGTTTRALDALKADVLANQLPQVSWIVATAEGSEHPGPSSPAQGAAYTAAVLDALTANPAVWAKTVLLINFDENDGFFDHVPPPAPPSYTAWSTAPAGASTVDTTGEYHEHLVSYHMDMDEWALLHRPYGLGPRVPLYVVSPWSKGGWVASEVFDHTSIIRFLEARFGVMEPNISAWRRAVCGDLTSALDFAGADAVPVPLPDTAARAQKARGLPHTTPPTPATINVPGQGEGVRPSRALPYQLHVTSRRPSATSIELSFANVGQAGAVFHVYDRLDLHAVPRRYTVEAGKALRDQWAVQEAYDLWVLGPAGFHRHFRGGEAGAEVSAAYTPTGDSLVIAVSNTVTSDLTFIVTTNRYESTGPIEQTVAAGHNAVVTVPLSRGPWYDATVTVKELAGFSRRFAGRIETGRSSHTDPAMYGPAVVDQD